MANVVAQYGFVPEKYLNGAAWNGAVNLYHIPSTDGSQFNVGDPVVSVAGADANGIPSVAKATGTATVRGVIVGCLPIAPGNPSFVGTNIDLTLQNIPATKTKDYYVLVCDDPKVVFKVKDDGLAALTASAVGKNASFTVANPTSPSQKSASVLATGTVATTNTLNLKILGLVQEPNNAFGANAAWMVIFNEHELNGNTAGV